MSIEGVQKKEKVNIPLDELQNFFNRQEWDLPEMKRDLTIPQNVAWLNRNFGIRNEIKPEEIKYWEALKILMKANASGVKYEDV